MQDARVRGALIVICLACLLGSGGVLWRGRQAAPPPIVFSAPPVPGKAPDAAPVETPLGTPAAASARQTRLFVDVGGAVQRPALYVLPQNSRVMQAIRAAGGPTADADTDAVNLAEKLTDGEKVFVPKKSTAPKPAALDAAPMTPAAGRAPGATVRRGRGARGGSGRTAKLSADSGEQVGLNSATLADLERLPGVGPSMAAKIITYREQSGGFAKVDDLSLVPGIGPKKLAKLTPFVTLN